MTSPAPFCPGGAYYGVVHGPSYQDASAVAALTLTLKVLRNGFVDTSFVPVAVRVDPGYWSLTGTFPASWVPGDTIAVLATITNPGPPIVNAPVVVDIVTVQDPKLIALDSVAKAKADAEFGIQHAYENYGS